MKVGIRFPGSETVTNAYPLGGTWSIQVSATGEFVEDVQALVGRTVRRHAHAPVGDRSTIDVSSALVGAAPTGQGPVLLLGEAGRHPADCGHGSVRGRLRGQLGRREQDRQR